MFRPACNCSALVTCAEYCCAIIALDVVITKSSIVNSLVFILLFGVGVVGLYTST